MKVLSASYGDLDVANKMQDLISKNQKKFYISNEIFGDPNPSNVKYFQMKIESNQVIKEYKCKENDILIIPPFHSSRKKIGIFYSNNFNSKINSSISLSLQKINDCSTDVDIVTNVWNKIENNPFLETISWTNSSSHLNQILQILQCLFTAENIQSYEYVSFLEHDVLYPVGYFDYPDFDNNIICNKNYIGINKLGFQTLVQHDKPLSQITMKFQYAKKHFLSLLPNALLVNHGNVDKFKDEPVMDWFSKNPAVHINHGYNFTSHFNCYGKSVISKNDYWGEHEKYLYLFN
jgi:hypothetical protein